MPKFVPVSTEGYYPNNVSLLADLRAKTCTRTVGFVTLRIVLGLFVTNKCKEYVFCEYDRLVRD